MWVLIIMLSTFGSGGVSVTTQEFNTEVKCWSVQKIVMQMKDALHPGTKISATCVKK